MRFLTRNMLCGVTVAEMGSQKGTYTTEGITVLCEALKRSTTLTSLHLPVA